MRLYSVWGEVIRGAYSGQDSYCVWEGEPAALPLEIVQDAIGGLAEEYPWVIEASEALGVLREGDDNIVAQEPTDLLGLYAIEELQWRE